MFPDTPVPENVPPAGDAERVTFAVLLQTLPTGEIDGEGGAFTTIAVVVLPEHPFCVTE